MFEQREVEGFERALTGWIRRAGRDDPEAFAQMVAIIDGAKAQLVDAAAELRDADDDECEGHESLAGEHMGQTVYCDGTCIRRRAGRYSWADLGAALGVTRAAAQKRFGRKVAV